MKISILAKRLDYELVGPDRDIKGIAYFDEAMPEDIGVIRNKGEINKSNASVFLLNPILTPITKTLLMTYDNISFAMVKVCKVLMEEGILPDYTLPGNLQFNNKGYYSGKDTVISSTAHISPGVVIGDYVKIGDNCIIEPFAVIGSGSRILNDVFIGSGSKIGAESFFHYYDEYENLLQFDGCGKVVLNNGTHVGNSSIIERGTLSDTVVGRNCMIGNGVDIGHDVKIGDNCKIVSQTGIAGNVTLKNNVIVYGQVGISNYVTVGNNVVIKAKTLVSKSVDDNQTVFGIFGREFQEEIRLAAKIRNYFNRKEM